MVDAWDTARKIMQDEWKREAEFRTIPTWTGAFEGRGIVTVWALFDSKRQRDETLSHVQPGALITVGPYTIHVQSVQEVDTGHASAWLMFVIGRGRRKGAGHEEVDPEAEVEEG
jgi:hypothetical protein